MRVVFPSYVKTKERVFVNSIHYADTPAVFDGKLYRFETCAEISLLDHNVKIAIHIYEKYQKIGVPYSLLLITGKLRVENHTLWLEWSTDGLDFQNGDLEILPDRHGNPSDQDDYAINLGQIFKDVVNKSGIRQGMGL